MWPNLLATSTCWPQLTFPIAGPLSALRQSFQGHERLRIGGVPAHPRAFPPCGERLARRLGRPAADLPSFGAERGVLDHLASFTHVIEKPVRRVPAGATEAQSPFQQRLPGRLIAVVLELVQEVAGPVLARRVL